LSLTLDRAARILDARNAAMVACDADAFLALWADDCRVEGPAHLLEGKQALRTAMEASWAAMQPVAMVTRSLSVRGDAMFYEFAVVLEVRATGTRMLFTGMTYHEVDSDGLLRLCREYFDPAGTARRSAAESPSLAPLLAKRP
jgi:ketosteroid isomerase-like protein